MSMLSITASILNVREQPNKEARVLIQLPRSFRVARLDTSPDGGWHRVRADARDGSVEGWISAQYAAAVSDAPAAPPAPQTFRITADVLNVRASASKEATVVAKVPRGFRVTKLESSADGAWLHVRASGAEGTVDGWIAAQYAVAVDAAPAPAAPAAAAPAQAAPAAPAGDGAEFAWLRIARGELGVVEYAGDKDNPRIVEYHRATVLSDPNDETPWCSSFANWCMKQAGIKGSGQANARSWLTWGRKIDTPVHGCIVVLKRGTSTTSGHVGFFLEVKGEKIMVLGGNQSNSVKISSYPKADVLGYRLPA